MDPDGPVLTECTVSGPLSFVLRISWAVGIAPLNFKKVRGGWRIRISRMSSVYGQSVAILSALLTMAGLITDITSEETSLFNTNSNVNRLMLISELCLVEVVVIAGAYTSLNRMRCMIHCIARLNQINRDLNIYQPPSPSSNRKTWSMVILALLLGCFPGLMSYGLLMYEIINADGNVLSSSFYIFFTISRMKLILLVIQFTMIAMTVVPSLLLVNSCLKNQLILVYSNALVFFLLLSLFSSSYFKSVSIMKVTKMDAFNQLPKQSLDRAVDSMVVGVTGGEKKIAATLHQLTFVYCSLCDIIRQFDNSNGFILVLLLLSILLNLVITPYYMFREFFHKAQSIYSNTVLQVCWVAVHTSKLLMIVETCHRTHEQMELTKHLINQMRRYIFYEDFAILFELKRFNRHLLLNEVNYSPMQLFTLNRSLIATMLGSVTTYFIFAIQL